MSDGACACKLLDYCNVNRNTIASVNKDLILASLSPDIPEITSGAEIEKKGTPSSYNAA